MMRSFVCIPLDGLLELYDNLPQINKSSSKFTAFSLGKCCFCRPLSLGGTCTALF